MDYLVTLQDERKFGVTAPSINQAAKLAVQLIAQVPSVTTVSISIPSDLVNWWRGNAEDREVIFKIKPTNWK